MITLAVSSQLRNRLLVELTHAGSREMGGVLMAEHVGENQFVLRNMTFHRPGMFASFVRTIDEALGALISFFRTTNNEYRRFNYIGEWHSHPRFSLEPSPQDDDSMREIVSDPQVGASFVVLLVVRIGLPKQLAATLHTYLPDGSKHRSSLVWLDDS